MLFRSDSSVAVSSSPNTTGLHRNFAVRQEQVADIERHAREAQAEVHRVHLVGRLVRSDVREVLAQRLERRLVRGREPPDSTRDRREIRFRVSAVLGRERDAAAAGEYT